jgi:hypothetical protein
MTGAAGRFAEIYSSYLECPKEFLYMAYLTCLGSVLSKCLTLASEIQPQPRLFTVLLGQSADERKSTVINKTVEHFEEGLGYFSNCWGIGSAEGLQERLNENDRLLLCFDEFKQFVSKCRIDTSVLLPCVNTLFESNRYESNTKSRAIRLQNIHLSMLAASTVDTYERIWNSSFTAIGFNNRLFIVPGTAARKYSIPHKIPDSHKSDLIRQLHEIINFVGEGMELGIMPDAFGFYDEWYQTMERSIHAKRIDTYALRLMSLLAANEGKNVIDGDTIIKAIDLCDWQLSVRKIYDPIDADTNIAKMEERIRRQLARGPKSDRELKQYTNANREGLSESTHMHYA